MAERTLCVNGECSPAPGPVVHPPQPPAARQQTLAAIILRLIHYGERRPGQGSQHLGCPRLDHGAGILQRLSSVAEITNSSKIQTLLE